MKILPYAQGSLEWVLARAGIPTASEFDNLITPKGEIRKGQMPETYLAKKVAENWQNGPLVEFNTFDVEMGKILEEEAIPWLELEHSLKVNRVGLILDDTSRFGCSPDGLIESDECGVEVKCPAAHTHVRYVLGGKCPDDYIAQVQGAMLVTGYPAWRFLSYRRRFPNLDIVVARDEEFIKTLEEALDLWLGKFDRAIARLEEVYGAPRPEPPKLSSPEPDWVEEDANSGITP